MERRFGGIENRNDEWGSKKKGSPELNAAWSQFRGPSRDGRVAWLPERLPASATFEWKAYLPSTGVGGLVANQSLVVVGSRDPTDKMDLFQGFQASDGSLAWQHRVVAEGTLDYGNSPRATPLILGPLIYVQGAFGDLACLDIEAGIPLWQKNLNRDFGGAVPQWGFSGSPLGHGENVIVQPGGASGVIELDGITGEPVWKIPGRKVAYSSPAFLDERRIVGGDSEYGLVWDTVAKEETAKIPLGSNSFGVPSPTVSNSSIYMVDEGLGVRRLSAASTGNAAEITRENRRYRPDTHTPVLVDAGLLLLHNGLTLLDSETLEPRWEIRDRSFVGYGSIMATNDRALIFNDAAELLLVDFEADKAAVVSRLQLSEEKIKTLSHPALVGSRLYLQLGQTLVCLELQDL
ncbi:MAG: PQQ-binding-like beta-propeller repeat protein [Planctomycetota bacterium]